MENPNFQLNHNYDLEDWDLIALFKDTIWAEFIDEITDETVSRGGIHIPTTTSQMKDFYRIAQVIKHGPDCSECIKTGSFLLCPPLVGLKGLKKGPNGKATFFIREDAVMAVIEPKSKEAVEKKKILL